MADQKIPRRGNFPSLDGLAKEIRAALNRADASQRRADDLRITAGQLLLAARQEVAAQGLTWGDWLKVNVPDRSERDVRRLIALASAPDPEAAIKEHRRVHRETMQRKRTHVSPQPRRVAVISDKIVQVNPPAKTIRVVESITVIKPVQPEDRPSPAQPYNPAPLPPRREPVKPVLIDCGGDADKVARTILDALPRVRVERLVEALQRFLKTQEAALDAVGPDTGPSLY